jgi:hypothetical protein
VEQGINVDTFQECVCVFQVYRLKPSIEQYPAQGDPPDRNWWVSRNGTLDSDAALAAAEGHRRRVEMTSAALGSQVREDVGAGIAIREC